MLSNLQPVPLKEVHQRQEEKAEAAIPSANQTSLELEEKPDQIYFLH